MMNLVPCILFLLRSNTLFKDTLTYPPPQKCLNLESNYISFLLRPHTIPCVDNLRPLITPQSTPHQSVSVSIQIVGPTLSPSYFGAFHGSNSLLCLRKPYSFHSPLSSFINTLSIQHNQPYLYSQI